MKLYDDPRQRAAHLGGARGRARRDRVHPGQGGHARRAGRTRPSRPSGSASTSATSRKLARALRLRELALRPLRPGLRPHPLELRPASRSRGIAKFRRFLDEAADLVLELGGSLSGEHGDGQSRAELLPKMFGAELVDAFREFKAIWDPDWKMNPGKVVDPYRDRREPPARRRLRPAGGRHVTSPTRDDDGELRARDRRAASASASAARPTGSTSCARATWSRARRSTRPAAARGCSSRCSKGEVITDGWQRTR